MPLRIYRGFASYLAGRGCAVLTYDYRGTGDSRPTSLAGFKASTDAQLLPIRQLELFKERRKFENDANMSDADKKTKLAELDAKLVELARQMK